MPTQKQFLDSVGLTELLDELGQYLKTNIPTVNNATLTIQKNGTNVATFTANASTGATANITVPTATSDLTNDSGFLGDADVSYDANTKTLIIGQVSNYVMTVQVASGVDYKIVDSNSDELVLPLSIEANSSLDFSVRRYNGKGVVSVTMEGGGTITMGMDGPEAEWVGEDIINYYNRPYSTNAVTGNITITIS